MERRSNDAQDPKDQHTLTLTLNLNPKSYLCAYHQLQLAKTYKALKNNAKYKVLLCRNHFFFWAAYLLIANITNTRC